MSILKLKKGHLMSIQRKAFTMIELIFVIVILGILSSVAISKMAVTRDDAEIVKGRSQVASIRNAIILTRNQNMLQANGARYPDRLDALSSATSNDGDPLFGHDTSVSDDTRLLDYPIYSKNSNGNWKKLNATTYAFRAMNTDVNFTYNSTNGQFDCNHAEDLCKSLAE